ncbi:MAG: capsule assembly Wzi family protein, partial [Chitinophagales bacterium]
MFPYYCRCVAIVCTLSLCSSFCKAQFFDSLQATGGLYYRFSSKDHLPFWLISNQFGTVADQKNDLTSFVRVANKHIIASHEYQTENGLYDYNDLTLSYGVSIYNNNHFKSTFPEEGYVKLEYKNWSLRAGRFEETTGDLDPRLSTGSFGVSSNALPIPKIGIAVTDYTNIPFTSGWLQFKGTFAHGWLGNNRYIKNSYYHEKTFFLRIGPRNLKFYAGIEHFAEWGGRRSDEQ